jgi:hypothetical protein
MKKLISLFTVIALVLSMLVVSAFAAWDGTTVATAFASGTGTEADPFVIKTPEQLAFLAQNVKGGESYEGKFIVLGADIDLGGKEWLPIGLYKYENTSGNDFPFNGNFDGKGYTVSNYVITAGNNTIYAGLFGYVVSENAVIQNLTVSKATVAGKNYAGVVVGAFFGKLIKNVVIEADCSVTGTASVGGVAGRIIGGEGIYLVNKGTVGATTDNNSGFIGGISGSVGGNGKLSYSANLGEINAIAAFIGGIVGITGGNDGGGTVENCYNAGKVSYSGTKGRYVGGIIGAHAYAANMTYSAKNCYNLSAAVEAPNAEVIALGSLAGQSRNTGAAFTDCYTVQVGSSNFVGQEKAAATVTNCAVKSEAEIKALTAAIDAKIAENKVTPPASSETTAPETTAPSTPETNAPTTTPVKPSNPATGDASAIILAAVCVTGLAAVMVAKKKER